MLENLSLGQERDNVKQWHWSSPVDLNVSFFSDQMQASINNQYNSADLVSLRSKLAQYPGGTILRLSIFGPPDLVTPALAAINDQLPNMDSRYKDKDRRISRCLLFIRACHPASL